MSDYTLSNVLEAHLANSGITRERFAEIVARLYATGLFLRPDGPQQTRLYDDAHSIYPLLLDYFSLAGFRLQHNADLKALRLYPPEPKDAEDESLQAAKRLRRDISTAMAAYALTFRHLYQQAMDVGNLTPEGELAVSRTEAHDTMQLLLNRQPPPQRGVRHEAYLEMRAQKLIRLPEGFEIDGEELNFLVRPLILDFVTSEQIATVRVRTNLAATTALAS
jgi:hypothetical protein